MRRQAAFALAMMVIVPVGSSAAGQGGGVCQSGEMLSLRGQL